MTSWKRDKVTPRAFPGITFSVGRVLRKVVVVTPPKRFPAAAAQGLSVDRIANYLLSGCLPLQGFGPTSLSGLCQGFENNLTLPRPLRTHGAVRTVLTIDWYRLPAGSCPPTTYEYVVFGCRPLIVTLWFVL